MGMHSDAPFRSKNSKFLKTIDFIVLVKNRSIRRKCRKTSLFSFRDGFVHRVIHSFCGKVEIRAIAMTWCIFQKSATEVARKFHKPVTMRKRGLSSAVTVLCTDRRQRRGREKFCYPNHTSRIENLTKLLIYLCPLVSGQDLPKSQLTLSACRVTPVPPKFFTELSTDFVDNRKAL